MLDIPHLGPVPRTWTLHQQGSLTARTALALLDLGMLPPDAPEQLPVALVGKALTTWLEQRTLGNELLHVALHYLETGGAASDSGARLVLGGRNPVTTPIGKTLGSLEAKHPGLGQFVLLTIEGARDFVPLVTPAAALQLLVEFNWQGEDDERIYIEQLQADGEKLEDIDMVTRAKFDKSIPRWASQPGSQFTDPASLPASVYTGNRRTGKIARAARALHGVLRTHGPVVDFAGIELHTPDIYMMNPAAFVLWSFNDIIARVWDDWIDDMAGADLRECYAVCEWLIDTPPGDLREFFAGLEPFFAILRALDELLVLISSRDQS